MYSTNESNSRVLNKVREELETVPGYMKEDVIDKMKELLDLPFKFDSSIFYFEQYMRIYPKDFAYRILLHHKLESILTKKTYLLN